MPKSSLMLLNFFLNPLITPNVKLCSPPIQTGILSFFKISKIKFSIFLNIELKFNEQSNASCVYIPKSHGLF